MSIEHEFSKISPSMIIFNLKLYDDAVLPEEVLQINETIKKDIERKKYTFDKPYSQRHFKDPITNRKIGCLFGLAIGDALGAPVEFEGRGCFEPVTDLRPGGAFDVKAGGWTDDTAMALCLGQSLIERKGFDPKDQMEKYMKWLDTGYLSAEERAIGLGNTIAVSLEKFRKTGNPFCGSTDPMTAGNGTIMKLAPVPMYYHPDHGAAVDYSVESSKTTHRAQEVLDSCSAMASILCHLFDGKDKKTALNMVKEKTFKSEAVSKILSTDFAKVDPENLESTGYVIHTLNSALWAFATSDSFEEALLKAVNLGDDADTVGAVCGQFAGAYWGYSGIPEKWLSKVARFGLIMDIGEKLIKLDSFS